MFPGGMFDVKHFSLIVNLYLVCYSFWLVDWGDFVVIVENLNVTS